MHWGRYKQFFSYKADVHGAMLCDLLSYVMSIRSFIIITCQYDLLNRIGLLYMFFV